MFRRAPKRPAELCERSDCWDPGLIVFEVTRYDSADHVHHDRAVHLCPRHAREVLTALGSPTRPCPARSGF